jgi:hypothetical protein
VSSKIRTDSGDAFHAWEPLQATRQDYANAVIRTIQREGGRSFGELLGVFREAGREWDREESFRRRAAA